MTSHPLPWSPAESRNEFTFGDLRSALANQDAALGLFIASMNPDKPHWMDYVLAYRGRPVKTPARAARSIKGGHHSISAERTRVVDCPSGDTFLHLTEPNRWGVRHFEQRIWNEYPYDNHSWPPFVQEVAIARERDERGPPVLTLGLWGSVLWGNRTTVIQGLCRAQLKPEFCATSLALYGSYTSPAFLASNKTVRFWHGDSAAYVFVTGLDGYLGAVFNGRESIYITEVDEHGYYPRRTVHDPLPWAPSVNRCAPALGPYRPAPAPAGLADTVK